MKPIKNNKCPNADFFLLIKISNLKLTLDKAF